jgi:hypothetical protein
MHVLCQSTLSRANHVYLTYFKLQGQLSHLNCRKLDCRTNNCQTQSYVTTDVQSV